MKALVVGLVLIVVVVVCLGFYRGWFQFSTENADHQPSATITVDENKMQQDKEKVQGLGHKAKERTGEQKANEKAGDRADEVEGGERRP